MRNTHVILQGSFSGLLIRIATAILWFGHVASAIAAEPQDPVFLKAIQSWQSKNPALLAEAQQTLQAQAHPLAPYAEYWALSLQLSRVDAAMVRDFLQRYADFPFQDRLRGEWLKVLGKRQDWQTFMQEWPNFRRDDMAVQCYALQARHLSGDSKALAEAKQLWLNISDPPENCETVFDLLQNQGLLTEQDIWLRIRLAMQEGKVSVAKENLSRRLPSASVLQKGGMLDKIYQNPQRFLESSKGRINSAWEHQLHLVAMERLARSQPEYALTFWQKYQRHYSAEEQNYFWGRLALYAARKHLPQAMDWYAQITPDAPLDAEQWAWKARAAIRGQNWQLLSATINAMPTSLQQEAVWRYWKARTLKFQQQTVAANSILLPLSRERSYYGLLAEESLGDVIGAIPNDFKINESDVQKAASLPGIQRASALQNYDLRFEARQEWQLAILSLDDRQLLALAEYAARQQWYDLSILTADKTRFMHDSALRYPTPFRELMQNAAQAQALETDWVYGIIRQESRFMHFARSGAGAVGLMQVMPATASWIAKRMGWQDFRQDKVREIDSNIRLGTYYMRYTLDTLNGQMLLATAAYNAGPSRARRWLGQDLMDGTIYAETIPFTETRQYVQKVMANTYYYAQRLGLKLRPMTQRMTLSAQQSADTVQDSENNEKIVE